MGVQCVYTTVCVSASAAVDSVPVLCPFMCVAFLQWLHWSCSGLYVVVSLLIYSLVIATEDHFSSPFHGGMRLALE